MLPHFSTKFSFDIQSLKSILREVIITIILALGALFLSQIDIITTWLQSLHLNTFEMFIATYFLKDAITVVRKFVTDYSKNKPALIGEVLDLPNVDHNVQE